MNVVNHFSVNTLDIVVTCVTLGLLIVGFFGLKIVKKMHEKDPEYQRKKQEREREARRRMEEDRELEDLALSMNGADYSDEPEDR